MIPISSFFSFDAVESGKWNLEIYRFSGDPNSFINECVVRYREAYISNNKIEDILKGKSSAKREDVIIRRLPVEEKNKSGDFGEILCYYFAGETWAIDTNIRPQKVRWKELPDMPSHLTDVVFFKLEDINSPSSEDKMITIESKARSSKISGDVSSINDAIIDANKDAIGRAAKTISYLVTHYEDDGNYDESVKCERFADPVSTPYQRVHSAVAIVEESEMSKHLANFDKTLRTKHPNIMVYLMPITGMRSIVDSMYDQIPHN